MLSTHGLFEHREAAATAFGVELPRVPSIVQKFGQLHSKGRRWPIGWRRARRSPDRSAALILRSHAAAPRRGASNSSSELVNSTAVDVLGFPTKQAFRRSAKLLAGRQVFVSWRHPARIQLSPCKPPRPGRSRHPDIPAQPACRMESRQTRGPGDRGAR